MDDSRRERTSRPPADDWEQVDFSALDQAAARHPVSRSVGRIVLANAQRSRALTGDDATANALIENLGDLHRLIEDQAGSALSGVMIDHVTSLLTRRSLQADRRFGRPLPPPERIHPTARLLGGDALENALILNGQTEENEALVAYTSATLTAISESLAGVPDAAAMVERIRARSANPLPGPRAVTLH